MIIISSQSRLRDFVATSAKCVNFKECTKQSPSSFSQVRSYKMNRQSLRKIADAVAGLVRKRNPWQLIGTRKSPRSITCYSDPRQNSVRTKWILMTSSILSGTSVTSTNRFVKLQTYDFRSRYPQALPIPEKEPRPAQRYRPDCCPNVDEAASIERNRARYAELYIPRGVPILSKWVRMRARALAAANEAIAFMEYQRELRRDVLEHLEKPPKRRERVEYFMADMQANRGIKRQMEEEPDDSENPKRCKLNCCYPRNISIAQDPCKFIATACRHGYSA